MKREASIETAVLFLVFNRPETTARVFEAIRAAAPKRLYVAADGPRPDRPGEASRCAEVRGVASRADWPCELHTLFRDHNLGCKLAVSQAITWFFEHEEEGVILEDDVLPVPSFFPFCEALLERYRDDARVAMIGGCNHLTQRHRGPASYFFSAHINIWGWATWRRAWSAYDVRMQAWPGWDAAGGLLQWLNGNRCMADYWRWQFDRSHRARVDTWDYQWIFACWRAHGLTVLPSHTLTLNLGFGPDATHTVKEAPDFVRLAAPRDVALPLLHPELVEADPVTEQLIQRHVLGLTRLRCLRRAVKSALQRRLSARPRDPA